MTVWVVVRDPGCTECSRHIEIVSIHRTVDGAWDARISLIMSEPGTEFDIQAWELGD